MKTWLNGVLLATVVVTSLPAMSTTELDQAWNGLQTPQAGLDSRFTYCILLEAIAANWHPERFPQLLATCQAEMDLNSQSATYGNCGIGYGMAPTDPNVGVFCMQSAIIAWTAYRNNLTPSEMATLRSLLTAGLVHVKSYSVNPDYSNMYLLKASNLITMGEGIGDASAAATGYAMLQNMISYTQQNGIHEFCSPTYYGVDLEALGVIQRLATSAPGKASAQIIQNLIWADIAANWYAPAERIGGGHSRDHDYLHGFGKSDVQLQAAGWLTNRVADIPEAFPSASSSFTSIAATTPPGWTQAIRQIIPRTITAHWGMQFQNMGWQQRTSYYSSHVALGTSGGSYCQEDKLINAEVIGNDDTVTNFCYVMDAIGAPYGTDPTANHLGNTSLQHLQPTMVSQQTGPDALVLISENLSTSDPGFSAINGVHSDILLPSSAMIWSGESQIAMPAVNQGVALILSRPVFIQQQDCAVGFRFLQASTVTGAQATLTLINDGGSLNSCRLLCEHSVGVPASSFSIQVAMHVRVADGLSPDGFAAFRNSFEAVQYGMSNQGGILDVSVALSPSPFHLALNTTTSQPTIFPSNTNNILSINGVDVGAQILQGLVPQLPASTTTPPNSNPPTTTPNPIQPTSTPQPTTVPSTQSSGASQPQSVPESATSSGSASGCGIGSGVGLLLLLLRARSRSPDAIAELEGDEDPHQ